MRSRFALAAAAFVLAALAPGARAAPGSEPASPRSGAGSLILEPSPAPPYRPVAGPRLLANDEDFARIVGWAARYAWARDARAAVVAGADAYPSDYMSAYDLAAPDPPPAGGQWALWYIGPDGLRLQYQHAHSPPHYWPTTREYLASPPQWPDRPALYDEVILARRHDALSTAARWNGLAYKLSGERRYADSAAAILAAYASRYQSYPLHDKDGKATKSAGRVHAQTLDEAIWLVGIAWAYDLVRETLPTAARADVERNLLRPAVATIQRNAAGMSNWQTWHNAAIAAAGIALNDRAMVALAYDDPAGGFFAQLAQGAAADGFWWEGSWGYHFFALEPMLYLAEMGQRAGKATWAQPNLRSMLSAPLLMAQPDLRLPPFNDDGGTTLAGGSRDWMYELGYGRTRDPSLARAVAGGRRGWQALLWGAEELPAPDPAAAESSLLGDAGYAVLRAGPPADPRYLAFKLAPHGGWHGHYDELGYVGYALGRTMAIDPGTHSYAAASHEGWDKTTVAHESVVVDEQSQKEATGTLRAFVGLPAFSLARAETADAYPGVAALGRTVVLTADYWLDVAAASALDGKPHRYDWIHHAPGTLTPPPGLELYASLPKANGYGYLTNARAAATAAGWQAAWDASGPYGSVYRNDDAIAATFTLSRTAGNVAGQLDYDFGTVAGGYAVFSSAPLRVPSEVPARFDLRVFGDGSGNRLSLRVIDATGEKFVKTVGPVSWTGWQSVAVPVDGSWSHSAGNGDGVMDLPVGQVAVQVNRVSRSAGRLLVDDLALAFPSGRVVVEDFESASALLQLRVLGAAGTTVVVGDGIDQNNGPVPFAMARREARETAFAALFEPYRTAPRVTAADMPSPDAFHVVAEGAFDDWSLLPVPAKGDRAFGPFVTDASASWVRRDPAAAVQAIVVSDATRLASGGRAWLSRPGAFTAQVGYSGDLLAIVSPGSVSGLRVYAPGARRVTVNGRAVEPARDGDFLVVP